MGDKNIKFVVLSCDWCCGEGIIASCEIDELDNELRQWGKRGSVCRCGAFEVHYIMLVFSEAFTAHFVTNAWKEPRKKGIVRVFIFICASMY